jgi:hypothetical protein
MSVDVPRAVDRVAGWLGVASLVTLLGSEAALTLPNETAAPATLASFYADHRPTIVVLQLVGLVSCAVLALFAWRLLPSPVRPWRATAPPPPLPTRATAQPA